MYSQAIDEKTMRIGVFGGTFDPIHYGHLLLAECCREQASLDAVWFVPAAVPPHKQGREISSPEHRLNMLKLAVGGYSEFSINQHELDRPGPSYTVDTLVQFKAVHSDAEFLLMMGADSLRDFSTWKDPARILEIAKLLVVRRGAEPAPNLNQAFDAASLQQLASSRVQYVEMPACDINATDLRERARRGLSLRFRTTAAVEQYIRTNRLYV